MSSYSHVILTGVGVDDMFLLVSAWRYTNYNLDVEERLGQSLKHASVSLIITTATDCLAFFVGTTDCLSIK